MINYKMIFTNMPCMVECKHNKCSLVIIWLSGMKISPNQPHRFTVSHYSATSGTHFTGTCCKPSVSVAHHSTKNMISPFPLFISLFSYTPGQLARHRRNRWSHSRGKCTETIRTYCKLLWCILFQTFFACHTALSLPLVPVCMIRVLFITAETVGFDRIMTVAQLHFVSQP